MPNRNKNQAYRVFKKNVKISYDPTEGIIKMEVVAADPDVSQEFSETLISYAEEQVDNLTQRLRADQMAGALDSFNQAEAEDDRRAGPGTGIAGTSWRARSDD